MNGRHSIIFMKYTQYFTVNSHDTDINGVVRPSAILRYMQETANLQFQTSHTNIYELNEQGKSFLLMKATYFIYKPLHNFDKIRVDTWACEGRGVTFPRCAQIYRDDELICELLSVWVLYERESRRFLSHKEIEFAFGTDKMLEIDLPKRLHFPKDLDFKQVGTRTTYYGDVDIYKHMNNTNYPDMLCSFIPDMEGKMVSSCSINFIKEAPLGHMVRVLMAQIGNTYCFKTIREDEQTGVEAEIILTDL